MSTTDLFYFTSEEIPVECLEEVSKDPALAGFGLCHEDRAFLSNWLHLFTPVDRLVHSNNLLLLQRRLIEFLNHRLRSPTSIQRHVDRAILIQNLINRKSSRILEWKIGKHFKSLTTIYDPKSLSIYSSIRYNDEGLVQQVRTSNADIQFVQRRHLQIKAICQKHNIAGLQIESYPVTKAFWRSRTQYAKVGPPSTNHRNWKPGRYQDGAERSVHSIPGGQFESNRRKF